MKVELVWVGDASVEGGQLFVDDWKAEADCQVSKLPVRNLPCLVMPGTTRRINRAGPHESQSALYIYEAPDYGIKYNCVLVLMMHSLGVLFPPSRASMTRVRYSTS